MAYDNDLLICLFVFSGLIFGIFFGDFFRRAPRYFSVPTKECLRSYVYSGNSGFLLECFDFMMSFLMSALYITETYIHRDSFFYVELVMAVYFNSYLLFHFYMSHDRMKHLLNAEVWIDTLTIFPIYLVFITSLANGSTQSLDDDFEYLWSLKLLKVFRFVRLSMNGKFSETFRTNILQFQVLKLIARLLCILLVAAAFIQILASFLEDSNLGWTAETEMYFHDALYFVVITLSTVGYGDLSPETIAGKLVICGLVLCFVIYLSLETENLIEIIKLRSSYRILPKAFKGTHFIISCGPNSSVAVGKLLAELFHPDHGHNSDKAVILCPCELDKDWGKLVLEWKSQNKVYFLRGDAQYPEDLKRASTSTAKAIFILADENAKDTRIEDTKAIATFMIVKSIYGERIDGEKFKIFLQVANNAAMKQLKNFGHPEKQIVCAENLKMMMLASASLWQGWPVMIANMICSNVYEENSTEEPVDKDKRMYLQKQQKRGIAQEIFEICLGKVFKGQTFAKAALKIYKASNITLFAVLRKNIHLSPGKRFVIQEGDKGFVVALDVIKVQICFEGLLSEQKHPNHKIRALKSGPCCFRTGTALADDMGYTTRTKGGVKVRKSVIEQESKSELEEDYTAPSATAITLSLPNDFSRKLATPTMTSLKVKAAKEGHVVVITQNRDEDFEYFVEFVTSPVFTKLKGERHIIVLCPNELQAHHHLPKGVEILRMKPNVVGFKMARVSEASLVIVTKSKTVFTMESDIDSVRTSNTEVLRILMDIRDEFTEVPRFLVELSEHSFLQQLSLLSDCHLYPHLEDKGTVSSKSFQNHEGKRQNDLYRQGEGRGKADAVISNITELLLARAYFDEDILNVVRAMLKYTEFEETTTSICHVSIPSSFKKTRYGELFSHLIEHYDAVPMGIVRSSKNGTMCITCPSEDFEISKLEDEIVCFCDLGNFEAAETESQQRAPRIGNQQCQENANIEQIQNLYERAAEMKKNTADLFEDVQRILREVQPSIIERK